MGLSEIKQSNLGVWVPLDASRLIMSHESGFLVVKPLGALDPVPLFCHVCKFPNLTSDDIICHRENLCCFLCTMKWVDIKREEWKMGWRPSQEDIQREIQRRKNR